MQTRPLVFAHRGASAYAPENTFAAFDLAIEMGAPAIETDVRATADSHLVLMHDERVDRTTDGHGKVSDLTLAEVRALDAGAWFGRELAGQRVPTVEEFLARYGGRLPICLEVKAPDVEGHLLDLVRAAGLLAKVELTSFSLDIVARLCDLAPEAKVGYLTPRLDEEAIAQTVAVGARQICPKAEALTPDRIRAARAAGLEVRAWGVGDDDLLARAVALGVDGFTTNWPDRALRMLGQRAP